jgi:rhamnulokinase
MGMKHYLACDLGAESGRLILGSLDGERLVLEELHRFPNTPLKKGASLHWNIPELFAELKLGLKKAGRPGLPISSISTDSWGVDYLLFDADGALLEPAFHYRDPRTRQGVEKAFSKTDWETIFAETGIQFMPINTLFQLAAEEPARLQKAELLLGVGDAFNYLLSGKACLEESMASTFQLYNPRTKSWSDPLLQALQLPRFIFPPVVPSGTRLGPLNEELARETGLGKIEVLATCSHDTGAAVAAVPATGKRWAYLSSGTWSLMGVELAAPVINDACRDLNFTNEIGYGGSIRLLKNIVGLWIVQECRRTWEEEGQRYSYSRLTDLAEQSPAFTALIDPADPRFIEPDDMPLKIAQFCRETGQPAVTKPGQVIRAVLESLALLYRQTLSQIEQLTGNKIEQLHIVGGGGKNHLLNQFAANALQIPVLAGPIEATAAGNILVQAIAMGQISSLDAARQIVRCSSDLIQIEPREKQSWDLASQRFLKITNKRIKDSDDQFAERGSVRSSRRVH